MRLHRVGEVARMLDVPPHTLPKWMKTGILHSLKLPGSHYNRFST